MLRTQYNNPIPLIRVKENIMANKVSKLSNKQKAPTKVKQSASADNKAPAINNSSSTANKVESDKKMPGFKLIPAVPKQ